MPTLSTIALPSMKTVPLTVSTFVDGVPRELADRLRVAGDRLHV